MCFLGVGGERRKLLRCASSSDHIQGVQPPPQGGCAQLHAQVGKLGKVDAVTT